MVNPLVERSLKKLLQRPCRPKCINIQEARGRTNDPIRLIRMDSKAWGCTNNSYILIEWVLLLFKFVRPNLYSRSGYSPIEGFMPVALTSLIEGYWNVLVSLLSTIGFNLYNVYVLLYGARTYGDISIFLYLGY